MEFIQNKAERFGIPHLLLPPHPHNQQYYIFKIIISASILSQVTVDATLKYVSQLVTTEVNIMILFYLGERAAFGFGIGSPK